CSGESAPAVSQGSLAPWSDCSGGLIACEEGRSEPAPERSGFLLNNCRRSPADAAADRAGAGAAPGRAAGGAGAGAAVAVRVTGGAGAPHAGPPRGAPPPAAALSGALAALGPVEAPPHEEVIAEVFEPVFGRCGHEKEVA